jgi:hypothetical protein
MRTENSNQISLFLTKVTASASAMPMAHKENVEGSGNADGWSMTGVGGIEPLVSLPKSTVAKLPVSMVGALSGPE